MHTFPSRFVAWSAVLALGAATLVGCSSSGGSSTGGSSPGGAAAAGSPPAASSPASPVSSAAPAAKAGVVLKTRTGPLGTYLTDGSGMTLYLFASDSATKSTCAGPCLTYWPPLEASGTVKAGSGVEKAKLATLTGTNGRKQVSYAGHPLYYYAGDSKPGDTNGQGSNQSGAKWWLLAPSGAEITRTAPLAPPSSSAP